MRDNRLKDILYMHHILECIEKIQKWHKDGKEYFIEDDKTQDAVIRNLQIMAESTQRLSDKAKAKYPAIDCHKVSGFRNMVVHEYLGLDVDIIWSIIEDNLPSLKIVIVNLLKETENEKY